MDPVSESLYLSDTNTRRVYRVKSLSEAKDLPRNYEVVAGTGEQCLPFDQSHCGDGGRASEASLHSPRGKGAPPAGSQWHRLRGWSAKFRRHLSVPCNPPLPRG